MYNLKLCENLPSIELCVTALLLCYAINIRSIFLKNVSLVLKRFSSIHLNSFFIRGQDYFVIIYPAHIYDTDRNDQSHFLFFWLSKAETMLYLLLIPKKTSPNTGQAPRFSGSVCQASFLNGRRDWKKKNKKMSLVVMLRLPACMLYKIQCRLVRLPNAEWSWYLLIL